MLFFFSLFFSLLGKNDDADFSIEGSNRDSAIMMKIERNIFCESPDRLSTTGVVVNSVLTGVFWYLHASEF